MANRRGKSGNSDRALKITADGDCSQEIRRWLLLGRKVMTNWSHSVMSDSLRPWEAHQAPQSVGFSRQEYWSGLPFPSPADLPDPGIEPISPVLAGGFFIADSPGKSKVEFKNIQLIYVEKEEKANGSWFKWFCGGSQLYWSKNILHLALFLENFHPLNLAMCLIVKD